MRRSKEWYLAIIIIFASIGLVMTLESGNEAFFLAMIYFAIYIIGAMRWLDEYLYHRRWNSPLVTGIFVVIPLLLVLVGSYISLITPILDTRMVNLTLNVAPNSGASFSLFISHFSIFLLLLPSIVLFFLLQRHVRALYHPAYLFRRPVHPRLLGISMLLVMDIFQYLLWQRNAQLDAIGLLPAIALTMVVIIRTIQWVLPNTRPRTIQGQAQRDAIARTMQTVSSRSNIASMTNQSTTRQARESARSIGPISRVRHGRQTIASSQNYSRSGNQIQRTATAKTNARNSNTTVRGHQRPLLPRTRLLTKDDFNCILCFQPPRNTDEPLVLCPHCHYPAHLSEWKEWHQTTDLCSRCNEKIPRSFLRNPKIVIPAKIYKSWSKASR